MATLSELDLFLAQGPENTRDDAEYGQLVKIYDALKYLAKNFANAAAADPTLDALAAFNTNGFLVQTAPDTFAGRTLQAPASGITITNPAGTAGDPVFALSDDLAALEALASTGIATRTAANTWAQRTITGTANEITLANGNGVSGNPTVSLPSALTFTGKTVTGGTYTGVTALTVTGTSTFNGDMVSNAGLSFGSAGVASVTDLSRHIQLYTPGYGFNVTSFQLNYNVGPSADHVFYVGGVLALRLDNTLADFTGALAATSGTFGNTVVSTGSIEINQLGSGDRNAFIDFHASGLPSANDYSARLIRDPGVDGEFRIAQTGAGDIDISGGGNLTRAGSTIWHAGNDGAGSGLDADLLDGRNSSTTAAANTVGLRNASADFYARYFNTGAAASENPTISQVMVTNGSDGFLRRADLAEIPKQARIPYVLATGSLTAQSQVVTVPSGNWKYLELYINNVTAASDFSAYIRINSNSTAGNYRYAQTFVNTNTGASSVGQGGTGPSAINLWSTTSNIESTSNKFSCKIRFYDPLDTGIRKNVSIDIPACIAAADGVVYVGGGGGGMWLGTAAISTIQVFFRDTAGQNVGGSPLAPSTGDYVLLGYL